MNNNNNRSFASFASMDDNDSPNSDNNNNNKSEKRLFNISPVQHDVTGFLLNNTNNNNFILNILKTFLLSKLFQLFINITTTTRASDTSILLNTSTAIKRKLDDSTWLLL